MSDPERTELAEVHREDEVPTIELYKVESIIVHASKMSRNALIGFVISLAAIVIVVAIFTSRYNARTKDWLDTIKMLVNRPAVTEVLQDENSGNIQQSSSP